MTRARRIDRNHPEIVAALRAVGATVQSLASVGSGCPDLLVGYVVGGRRANLLLEVKDGAKPPSAQRLTDDETRWHERWKGQVATVRSVDEALEMINGL